MQYYTNVFRKGNFLYVRGRDHDGNRQSKVVKYKPTLYLTSPAPESKYTNLKGQPLKPVSFNSMWDAREFVKRYDDIKDYTVFGFTEYQYSWITDNFPKPIEFDMARINVGNVDIETRADKGFPETEEAKRNTEITVISLQKNEKTYVLATKDYQNDDPNVVFFACEDEKDMLLKFIQLWNKLDLDVVTGWNIDTFDIPMLILRIEHLFDMETANMLSPWKKIERRERVVNDEQYVDWTIAGISSLDYMKVYMKFAPSVRDSYSLNYISYFELGEEKTDYSEYKNLEELWEKNPQLYIKYNINDTRLVAKLEKKLKYLERSIVVAYDAKVNYEEALGSVLLWECIFMNDLWQRDIIMPIVKAKKRELLKGAFVKTVQIGLFNWVLSFDLTSLYPHILIGWNISPETLVARRNVTIEDIIDEAFDKDELKKNNLGLAANGCVYDNTKRGFMAEVIEKQFSMRAQYKKKMQALEKQYEETKDPSLLNEITKYDNYQYGKKIQLNSAYGAIANPFFTFYNIDNAGAVTHTGQAVIKYIANRLNEFLSKEFDAPGDYIIASDTDSVYINLELFVKRSGLTDPKEIIVALDKYGEEVIGEEIKKVFEEFTSNLNAYKNALHMKRESIIEKALWRGKKNYAVWVWDQEGVRYEKPKLKIKGIEAVRSSTPEVCRKKIIEAIQLMFTDGEEAVQKLIKDFRDEYMELPIYDIARPIKVSDYVKHLSSGGPAPYNIGATKQAKAAILYNKFLKDNNLQNKYRRIHNGEKIKYLHLVKFNPIHDDVIGAPDGAFPSELNIEEYVDKHDMFDTTFMGPMTSIMKAAGWSTEKRYSVEDFFG